MESPKLAWAKEWLGKTKQLYVGNEWLTPRSHATLETINPYNGEVLGRISDAKAEDVDHAVSVAKHAFESGPWKKATRRERSDTLRKIGALIREHRAELATLETLDNGKTYVEAYNDDLPESADVFDYYAGWTDKFYGESVPVEKGFVNFTQNDPLGVCALIVPWNFPLLLACWKIAPALATGNTVILKPSPFTSLSSLRLAEILEAAKVLPPGVFNVVTGDVECGEAISKHSSIAKISFTGSTAVGKKIAEASGKSNLKHVTLELGGKSPNIIFDDVKDLSAVLDRSFTAMFCHKGEKCSEPTRFLVQKNIYEQVAQRLVEKAEKIVCGDPFDPKTEQGPQANEQHFNKILSYIEIGKAEGAKLLVGGERDNAEKNRQGFFIRPTIFGNVKNGMRIAQEEIFGPVLCLIPFETEEEAVQIANDTVFGLAAGVYTADSSRALRVAQRLDAGMVFVNHYGCYDFASPFGGVKQSGWGREMARDSLQSYTKQKSVWIRYE